MDELAYTVRVSRKTRRLHLVVSASGGLTVVVPPRFDRARIAPLLAARRDWIERATSRVEAERAHLAASRAAGRPHQLELPGIGESWPVAYRRSDATSVQARLVAGAALRLTGSVEDDALVGQALQRFVARRALAALGPMVQALAAERGTFVTAVTVRAQRTRWASCSASGAISLNRNLAFLPPALVRHVLLHELCHRIELNHSPRFWQLLDHAEPDRRALERQLASAWQYIPHWARC